MNCPGKNSLGQFSGAVKKPQPIGVTRQANVFDQRHLFDGRAIGVASSVLRKRHPPDSPRPALAF